MQEVGYRSHRFFDVCQVVRSMGKMCGIGSIATGKQIDICFIYYVNYSFGIIQDISIINKLVKAPTVPGIDCFCKPQFPHVLTLISQLPNVTSHTHPRRHASASAKKSKRTIRRSAPERKARDRLSIRQSSSRFSWRPALVRADPDN